MRKKNHRVTTQVNAAGTQVEPEDSTFEMPGPIPSENTLTENHVGLMKTLVEVQSHTRETKGMRTFIRSVLKQIDGVQYWTHEGNIYAIKGSSDLYPCVVCHTDTVHALNFDVRCFQSGDVLFAMDTKEMKQYGTGGDDKVGIWVAIECLKKFPHIKCVFFRDEEGGCHGSNLANMDFFNNTTLVLQCDRRGRHDITESISEFNCVSPEFREGIKHIVQKHNRSYVNGALTDVLALMRRGLKVCCMNMSCGYYDPHSNRETINLLHMQETFNFVCDLIGEVGAKQWLFPGRQKNNYYPFIKDDFQRWNSLYSGGSPKDSKVPVSTPVGKQQSIYDGVYSDWELIEGNWVKKKTGVDKENREFRTTIDDYCPMCGFYCPTKEEKRKHLNEVHKDDFTIKD